MTSDKNRIGISNGISKSYAVMLFCQLKDDLAVRKGSKSGGQNWSFRATRKPQRKPNWQFFICIEIIYGIMKLERMNCEIDY